MADRALGQVQFFGGLGEAGLACRDVEAAQCHQRGQGGHGMKIPNAGPRTFRLPSHRISCSMRSMITADGRSGMSILDGNISSRRRWLQHALHAAAAGGLLAPLAGARPAWAAGYPAKPIRLIVPSAAGGSPDAI